MSSEATQVDVGDDDDDVSIDDDDYKGSGGSGGTIVVCSVRWWCYGCLCFLAARQCWR